MQTTQFTTSLNIDEIKSRLSPLDNFKIEEEEDNTMTVKVGSLFKYKMIGVYLTDNYQAPLSIAVQESTDSNAPTTVQVSARSYELIDAKKASDFFERGFTEVRELLEA
ncbi:hypothetical protein QYQ98_06365 [Corynebacterium sp. P3-F1]|uniref:hypothetical protein n=1 Tax=Corynebacterium sp. P3-F1 TaxID=3059080 RepID=UPI00265CCC04|nr:hypothetical protein [Corynebacterium sp. P3-F1]WKK60679.1 hypothetical protein QYQ98_06365 [Corynebacterium sp. P3-F1]